MIATDTSTLIALLEGETGIDVIQLEQALSTGAAALPPVVMTEILSRPPKNQAAVSTIMSLPLLDVLPGYWERTALLRRVVLGQGLKSLVADALIAQSCLDHGVALITRDQDFWHYAAHGGLQLA